MKIMIAPSPASASGRDFSKTFRRPRKTHMIERQRDPDIIAVRGLYEVDWRFRDIS